MIIPCYNAEKYIEECVLSVLKQDYTPIEIIVVDDASTDASVSKIAEYPVIIIRNPMNAGECKTSARGFALATGTYVCRLSADDAFVNTNHISKQVSVMEELNSKGMLKYEWCYNSINLVGETIATADVCQSSWVPIPIRYSAWFFYIFDNIFLKFPNVCYIIALTRNPINSSALMFRTSTYKIFLTWDSAFRSVCDATLLGRIFLRGFPGFAIHSMGSFYRTHPAQATGKPETNVISSGVRKELFDNIRYGNHPLWMKLTMRFLYG
jgi:glycosyltransferase involved in cell wall biosynthesis